MSIDVNNSLGENQPPKFCTFDRKLKCQKSGHKQNPIMFICTQYDCHIDSRLGCANCFNDHDDHKQSQILIDQFMILASNKQLQLEPYFRDILDQSDYSRTKDEISVFKVLANQLKLIQKQISSIFQASISNVISSIEMNLISQGFTQQSSQNLRAFYSDLHKLKGKPLSHLQKQDYEFLLQFILNNDLMASLEQEKMMKANCLHQITQSALNYITHLKVKSEQFISVIQFIFIPSEEVQNSFTIEAIFPQTESYLPLQEHSQKTQQKIVASPQRSSRNKSASKISSSAQQEKGNLRSPGQGSKSSSKIKDYQLNKMVLLYQPALIKEYLSIQRVTQEDENFICYLLINYLTEDFLNDNLPFLQKLAPSIFQQDIKIDLRKKMQIIQKHRSSLMKILWENWMIDFLFVHLINIPSLQISYRLQNFEQNQQESFLLRLKKALTMHGIIVWFVVEQIQKPKPQILPLVLFAQGNLFKETYSHSQIVQNLNLPQFSLYYLQNNNASLLQSQFIGVTQSLIRNYNDQFDSEHIFQINKGNHNPEISAQILCERVNNLINMIKISYLVDDKQIYDVRHLEGQFQSLITNFDYFIKCLQKCFKKERELAQTSNMLI